MKEKEGSVYLIPSPIGAETPALGAEVLEKVRALQYFAVEEERTARRFLGECHSLLRSYISQRSTKIRTTNP